MTHDTLAEEHASLQRAVVASRHSPTARVDTKFVRDMQKVMDDYLDARRAGLTREQAIPGIEAVLRSVWAHRPTKFGPACDACEDIGWLEHVCWADLRCGRALCGNGHPSCEHGYVTACSCPKGDGPGGRTRKAALDDIGEAMKSRAPKKRGFSRFGGA